MDQSDIPTTSLVQILADRIGTDEAFVLVCVGLTLLFGGVGGSVFPVMPLLSGRESGKDRQASVGEVARSCWIGAAGALGFMFFEIALGAIKAPLSGDLAMRLVTVSVIAGYGSRRLLPLASDGLAGRLSEHQKETREADKQLETRIESLQKEVEQLEDFKENVTLEDRFKQIEDEVATARDFPDLIKRTTEKFKSGKANTSLVIYLGRYYRRHGEIREAILLLEGLLAQRGPERLGFNFARLNYNLACYYGLLAENEESDELAKKAVTYLAASLSQKEDRPILLTQAKNDPDLKWLHNKGYTAGLLQ